MILTILKVSERSKIDAFRIHESGDFYNQAYFEKWVEIINAFPHMQFYAYTKSFFINFENKPKNLILIASFDQSTPKHFLELYKRNEMFFDKTFSIVEKGISASCIQDCTKCSLCFTKTGLKENITVNVH